MCVCYSSPHPTPQCDCGTALHEAALFGKSEVVKVLMQKGDTHARTHRHTHTQREREKERERTFSTCNCPSAIAVPLVKCAKCNLMNKSKGHCSTACAKCGAS